MSTPPEKPKARINPLLLDDDEFRIPQGAGTPRGEPSAPEPRAMPDWVVEAVRSPPQPRVSAAEEASAPPRWPMLQGNLLFPFYLSTLAVWLYVSLGLTIAGWLLMFWIEYGALMGGTTARLLGMGPLFTGTLTLAYASTCCLMIIEDTSYGADAVQIAPELDWKGWVVNLFHIMALGLQAGLVGCVLQAITDSHSWLPGIAGTFAAFPLVLLGALAAEGAWVPTAIGTVLRSFRHAGWAWILFFLQVTPMAIGWTLLVQAGLRTESPYSVPAYAGPLLAVIILIYARLIGRLAGCIARALPEPSTEGD